MATSLANTPPRQSTTVRSGRSLAAVLRAWHLFSLDAPSVAVIWACAFAWAARVRLPWWPLAILALVVWAVYVGDRLLDARAGLSHPGAHDLHPRHYFHWRHRKLLAPAAALAALGAACLVRCRMPAIALPQDSAVAAATLAYFSGVHSRKRLPGPVARLAAVCGSREFVVGLLFAAGCVLPAWSVDPGLPVLLLLGPALYFSALAWLNVRAITYWEAPGGAGEEWVRRGARALALGGLLLGAGLLAVAPRSAALLCAGAMSAGMIDWLNRRRESIHPVTVRAAVDAVLLTPLLAMAAFAWVR